MKTESRSRGQGPVGVPLAVALAVLLAAGALLLTRGARADTSTVAEDPLAELWLQVPDALPPLQARVDVDWWDGDGQLWPWRNYLVDTNGRSTDLVAVQPPPPLPAGPYGLRILPADFDSVVASRIRHDGGAREAWSAPEDASVVVLPVLGPRAGQVDDEVRIYLELGQTDATEAQVNITASAFGEGTESHLYSAVLRRDEPLEIDVADFMPEGLLGTAYLVSDEPVAAYVSAVHGAEGARGYGYPGLPYDALAQRLVAPLVRAGRVADADVEGASPRGSRIAVQRDGTGETASLTVTYRGDDVDGNACRGQTIVHGGGPLQIPASAEGLLIDPTGGGLPSGCVATAVLASDDRLAAVVLEEDEAGAVAAAYPALPADAQDDEALGPRFQNETEGLRSIVHVMNAGTESAQVDVRFVFVEGGSTQERSERRSIPAGGAWRWTPAGLGVPAGRAGSVLVEAFGDADLAAIVEEVPTDADADGALYAAGRRRAKVGAPPVSAWHLVPRTWRAGQAPTPTAGAGTPATATPTPTPGAGTPATATPTAGAGTPSTPTASATSASTPSATPTRDPAACPVTVDVGVVAYAGNALQEALYDDRLGDLLAAWGSQSGGTATHALFPRDAGDGHAGAGIDGYGPWLEAQLASAPLFDDLDVCAHAWLVVTDYNDLVRIEGALAETVLGEGLEPSDFLPEAWAKTRMPPSDGGRTKALPWLRDECSDSFRFLGLAASSDAPAYGEDLARQLVDIGAQETAYEADERGYRLGHPTLLEPYVSGWPSGAPFVECPPLRALPPATEAQIEAARRAASDTAEALRDILPSYDPGGDLKGPKLSQVVSFALPVAPPAAPLAAVRQHGLGRRAAGTAQAGGLALAGTVMDYREAVDAETMAAWLDRPEGVLVGEVTIFALSGPPSGAIYLPLTLADGAPALAAQVDTDGHAGRTDGRTAARLASQQLETPLRYAVRWHREGGAVRTSYVAPDGSEHSDAEIAALLGIPVLAEPVLGPDDGVEPSAETTVWTEEGSRKYCLKVDSRRYCLSFG